MLSLVDLHQHVVVTIYNYKDQNKVQSSPGIATEGQNNWTKPPFSAECQGGEIESQETILLTVQETAGL